MSPLHHHVCDNFQLACCQVPYSFMDVTNFKKKLWIKTTSRKFYGERPPSKMAHYRNRDKLNFWGAQDAAQIVNNVNT